MSKFKIGDAVVVKSDLTVGNRYGRESFVGQMRQCLGEQAKVTCVETNGLYRLDVDNGRWNWTDEMLTQGDLMENLQAGDVLVNKHGNEETVLFANGHMIITDDGDSDHCTNTYIIKNLAPDEFRVKGAEPEVKELTLDEVAEAMNIPVGQLRIKKES